MSHATADPVHAGISEREEELLLHCARWRIDKGQAAHIAVLASEPIRWDAAHAFARRHGIVPQLNNALSAFPEVVPANVRADLRAECDANTVRNVGLTAEVIRVLRALELSDVAALSYKGPALALQVYGSLSARQFGDLDILVRRHDIVRATSALIDLGYTGDPWPAPSAEREYIRRTNVHVFCGSDGTRLELHWEFVPSELPARLDVDEMWSRLEQIRLGDLHTVALAPEDLLLVLCVHGCRHVWARLKAVCDIAEVVTRLPLDWPEVFHRAQRAGALRMVLLGIVLARDLLHISPESGLAPVLDADPAVRLLSATVRERLFSPFILQPASPGARLFYSQLGDSASSSS